jgi:hypothetical protein
MELNRLVFRLNLPVFKTGSIRQTVGKKKELGFLKIAVGTHTRLTNSPTVSKMLQSRTLANGHAWLGRGSNRKQW